MTVCPLIIPVVESSQVGEARRAATQMAAELGFNATVQGEVAIAATEAANNLVKHAQKGQIVLQAAQQQVAELEIIAIDSGPGIGNLDQCLRDGYSTAGTRGEGLGAIQRLSDAFDMYSGVDGTVILARFWNSVSGVRTPPSSGGICVPYPGEDVCGDAWKIKSDGSRKLLMVADGLGHGPLAAVAAREAIRILGSNGMNGPRELLEAAHGALRSTRGAAVSVAEINDSARTVRYAGVGNVSAMVVSSGQSRSMVSMNGTIGAEARKIQEFDYEWPVDGVLLMYSDGLLSQVRLDHYPGLAARDPSLIAAVLYRDFKRGRDDATIVVVKHGNRP